MLNREDKAILVLGVGGLLLGLAILVGVWNYVAKETENAA